MRTTLPFGFAVLLGAAGAALAIEPPDSAAPIPPQSGPAEASEPSLAPAEDRELAAEEEPEATPEIPRAYLGVGGSQVPDLLREHLGLAAGEGVVVRSLDPDGPAAKAGLAGNDVITKVGGKPVGSHEQLREAVAALKPGDGVDVNFIHHGEARSGRVTLGRAPERPRIPGGRINGAGGLAELDDLMLDGMPQDQAKRIREAIEQNLKAFGADRGADGMEELMGRQFQDQMHRLFQGMELPEAGEAAEGVMGLRSSSAIRMMDDQGSVELKSEDGGKTVRVFGKDGQVQWEGPYDTPQDKEAAPPEIRERIERLNIDMDFKGNGLRLRMLPRPGALEQE
jgi:hypothetical protein